MVILYFCNLEKKHLSFLALSFCITRFFGHVYLEDTIPNETITYFSYLCAFSGCLFSHFIKKSLEELSYEKTNSQTLCNNRSILIKNGFDSNLNSNDKKSITRNNMRRKTFYYNTNSSTAPSNLYKRRTSLPIKFEVIMMQLPNL